MTSRQRSTARLEPAMMLASANNTVAVERGNSDSRISSLQKSASKFIRAQQARLGAPEYGTR